MPDSHLIFLGGYTKVAGRDSAGRGIYTIRLDDANGTLGEPAVVAEVPDPAWVTLSPDKKYLYAISGSAAQAIGFKVDGTSGQLTPLPAEKSPAAAPPSHLAVDATGRTLLAANYREGYVSAIPIHTDGTLGAPNSIRHSGTGPNPKRQEAPHVHSVTLSPDNRFVMVCDLGLDKVFTYALDAAAAKLTPANPPFATFPPGGGPRHFKFGADGHHAYVISEMGSTITACDYTAASGALTPKQTVSTVPADFKGENWSAEIRVHPNGKFVYGSDRGNNSLAVFAIDAKTGLLSPVEIVSSGGKTPRNFALSPDGKWLVCAHQDSDNLTVFKVDAATGRLTLTKSTATVPACVCVLFYN